MKRLFRRLPPREPRETFPPGMPGSYIGAGMIQTARIPEGLIRTKRGGLAEMLGDLERLKAERGT